MSDQTQFLHGNKIQASRRNVHLTLRGLHAFSCFNVHKPIPYNVLFAIYTTTQQTRPSLFRRAGEVFVWTHSTSHRTEIALVDYKDKLTTFDLKPSVFGAIQ